MRTLVVGWFSFEQGHATAGDLMVRDLTCDWLDRANYPYDVAMDPSLGVGVDWRTVNPQNYSHVVFVCGPFEKSGLELAFLTRFSHHRLIGLNLSMQVPLHEWNPFDFLIERDSSAAAHAEMAFLAKQAHVPVVGVCLVETYPGALVEVANAAIHRLVAAHEISVVPIDTRLDMNSTGLRTPTEIESLLARMDVVITTRLHGMVLALKNGVPVLAIDPAAGGAKILRQAQTIGWPIVFNADELNDDALKQALQYCMSDAARSKASECRTRAIGMVEQMRDEFIATLASPEQLEQNRSARLLAAKNSTTNTLQQDSSAINSPIVYIREFLSRATRLIKKV